MRSQEAFRSFLHQQFADLQIKNPGYSLRAFARRLKVSPSSISEVLRGKRRISIRFVQNVLDRLDVNPDARAGLLAGWSSLEGAASQYSAIGWEQFQLMSNWQCFAVLALVRTEGYRHDSTWIAQRLGVTSRDAQAAMQRLEDLELLRVEKVGKTVRVHRTQTRFTTSDDLASVALRKLHHQNLDLVRRSLEEDAVEERDVTALNLVMDRRQMPLAKKLIREMTDQLSLQLESGRKREVYKLCVQLIPVSGRGGSKK